MNGGSKEVTALRAEDVLAASRGLRRDWPDSAAARAAAGRIDPRIAPRIRNPAERLVLPGWVAWCGARPSRPLPGIMRCSNNNSGGVYVGECFPEGATTVERHTTTSSVKCEAATMNGTTAAKTKKQSHRLLAPRPRRGANGQRIG